MVSRRESESAALGKQVFGVHYVFWVALRRWQCLLIDMLRILDQTVPYYSGLVSFCLNIFKQGDGEFYADVKHERAE